MTQPTDKTSAYPIAHLAMFVAGWTADSQAQYVLWLACEREPRPGDIVTTAVSDVTCKSCALKRPGAFHSTTRRTLE